MRDRAAALLMTVVLVAVAASCAVPIADLGGPSSTAIDVNGSGIVVGGSELPSSTAGHRIEHAYLRYPDDTVVDLPPLPGHESSTPTGINDDGVAVGTSWGWAPAGTPLPPELMPRGVMWDASGTVTELGALEGAATEPIDINADGIVVGTAGSDGFVFDPAVGHVEALPELPGTNWTYPRAVNDLGIAVGYAFVGDANWVTAVRWDLAAGTVEDLSPAFDERFIPYGLNDAGSMVGMVANPSPAAPEAAVVVAGSSAVIRLGTGPWSAGTGINASGTVVASSLTNQRAFWWEPTTGAVELAVGQPSYVWAINDGGSMVGMADDQAVFFGVPSTP
jgi:uncharacterized membrane protein